MILQIVISFIIFSLICLAYWKGHSDGRALNENKRVPIRLIHKLSTSKHLTIKSKRI